MVKLNKIYTRTGDDGTTGLVAGPRRLKHDARVEAYGDIDETNSVVAGSRVDLVQFDHAGPAGLRRGVRRRSPRASA